jgi:hypothetical protein
MLSSIFGPPEALFMFKEVVHRGSKTLSALLSASSCVLLLLAQLQ